MPARDTGANAGAQLDKVSQKSYQDIGYNVGEKFDKLKADINGKYVDRNGKTPEDHFKELYAGSASLVGNTYNYAWSWVPFTKKKAHQAKDYAAHTNASEFKNDVKSKGEEAKSKGQDLKEDAKNTELPGNTDQTIGGLINEARGLAGQFLDTAVYYVKVAEEKADEATSDAKGTAKDAEQKGKAKSRSYVDQARGLTAYVLERTSDIITFGQQKAGEAADELNGKTSEAKSYADSVKQNGKAKVGEAKDKVSDETQTNGDRPHFAVSVQL